VKTSEERLAEDRPVRGDAGFSLVELSVAMLVCSVVAGAAGVMVMTGAKSARSSEARLDTINSARVSVESMSRSLRTAVLPRQLDNAGSLDAAFLQASPRRVSFYANINNPDNTVGPSRVTYALDGTGNLIQTIQAPNPHAVDDHDYKYCDLALSSCPRSTRSLTPRVDTSQPLFRYFDQDGAELPLTATCVADACLSPAALEDVDAVEVKVVVAPPPDVAIGSTTYVTRVSLPNHDAVIREGNKT
jgi:prepilin-type N-terminal cleavage/methylation domain-containing protein